MKQEQQPLLVGGSLRGGDLQVTLYNVTNILEMMRHRLLTGEVEEQEQVGMASLLATINSEVAEKLSEVITGPGAITS